MGFFGSGVNASRTLQAFDRSLAITRRAGRQF
jgi:hypothetical protein